MDENKTELQQTAEKVGQQVTDVAEKAGQEATKLYEEAKKAWGPGLKSFADKLKASLKGEAPKKES